jgi:hypothetical protein
MTQCELCKKSFKDHNIFKVMTTTTLSKLNFDKYMKNDFKDEEIQNRSLKINVICCNSCLEKWIENIKNSINLKGLK